jgi:hypothetical protein
MKKPERILFVANNSGTIYQRNIYETKTATALIIRTEEVSPLPCLQRAGLACRAGIVAVSARNRC